MPKNSWEIDRSFDQDTCIISLSPKSIRLPQRKLDLKCKRTNIMHFTSYYRVQLITHIYRINQIAACQSHVRKCSYTALVTSLKKIHPQVRSYWKNHRIHGTGIYPNLRSAKINNSRPYTLGNRLRVAFFTCFSAIS